MRKKCWSKILLLLLVTLTLPLFSRAQITSKVDSLNYLLEVTKSDSVRVNLLISLSREHSKSNLGLSLQYGQKALSIAESTKNKGIENQALMNLGTICFQQGLLDLSVNYLYRSLSQYRDMKNIEGEANALTNLGAIQLQMINLNEAKDYFLDALDVYNQISEKKGDTIPPYQLLTIYNNLGIISENEGNFNEAIEYYQRGIGLARRLPKSSINLAMLLNNLGSTYMKMGKNSDALVAMQQALSIRQAGNDLQGVAMSHRMLGIFFMGIDKPDSMMIHFWRGYKLATSVGSTPLLSSISEKLFEYYTQKNRPDSALKYHILLKSYSDQLNKEKTLKELSVLELTSQFHEKEKIRELEQKKLQLRYAFTAIVLVLIVIIFGLLYAVSQSRNRRLILKNRNIELANKNAELEREALSKELEIKNKELTTNVMYQIRKNELINSIAEKLISNSHNFKKENQNLIKEIIKELEETQDESIWTEFESRFHQVHNEFYSKLNQINPDLSPNERRLCAFLRLNMSTKEISSITSQSLRSIEVARTRLRKKLNLTNTEQGLIEYLSTL